MRTERFECEIVHVIWDMSWSRSGWSGSIAKVGVSAMNEMNEVF